MFRPKLLDLIHGYTRADVVADRHPMMRILGMKRAMAMAATGLHWQRVKQSGCFGL